MTYSEVSHVGDEDVALDNLGDGRAGLLQDGLEVLAALLGLVGDGALNQNTLSSEGNLTRAVDGSRGLDGLGLIVLLMLALTLAVCGWDALGTYIRANSCITKEVSQHFVLISTTLDPRYHLRAGAFLVKMMVWSAIVDLSLMEAGIDVNFELKAGTARRATTRAIVDDIPVEE